MCFLFNFRNKICDEIQFMRLYPQMFHPKVQFKTPLTWTNEFLATQCVILAPAALASLAAC